MARIRIYIGRHLCTAPRPVKEADALAAAGHDVSVHGLWFDPRLVARDRELLAGRPWRFAPYADCQPGNAIRTWRWGRVRLAQRFARECFVRFRRVLPDLYGYATRTLTRHALRNDADLTIFHSEGGLWAASQLHRTARRVGFDFEDWFSEDLLPADRRLRPVTPLRALELAALRAAIYTTTTTDAMAGALAQAAAARPPEVVYNTFAADVPTATPPSSGEPLKLLWLSQTVGPGRGLELLFEALPQFHLPVQVTLVGDLSPGSRDWLARVLPPAIASFVQLRGTVAPAQLPALIAQHHAGLALEIPYCANKELTASNKLFHYLLAGLPVLATPTAGQREVLTLCGRGGWLADDFTPAALAAALRQALPSVGDWASASDAAAAAVRTHFSLETQQRRMAVAVAQALLPSTGGPGRTAEVG